MKEREEMTTCRVVVSEESRDGKRLDKNAHKQFYPNPAYTSPSPESCENQLINMFFDLTTASLAPAPLFR